MELAFAMNFRIIRISHKNLELMETIEEILLNLNIRMVNFCILKSSQKYSDQFPHKNGDAYMKKSHFRNVLTGDVRILINFQEFVPTN